MEILPGGIGERERAEKRPGATLSTTNWSLCLCVPGCEAGCPHAETTRLPPTDSVLLSSLLSLHAEATCFGLEAMSSAVSESRFPNAAALS